MFGATSNPWFDRSILVTSASEGLGPDLVRALVGRGARPIAVGRDGAALARLAQALGGISWLADDAFSPDRALPIARWLADEHAGLGGFIFNLPATTTDGNVFAPLALVALTGGFDPEAPLGLLIPDAPPARRLARLASRLQDLRWSARSAGALTAVVVPTPLSTASDAFRHRAAGRILDGLAARRASVRIASPHHGADLASALAPA